MRLLLCLLSVVGIIACTPPESSLSEQTDREFIASFYDDRRCLYEVEFSAPLENLDLPIFRMAPSREMCGWYTNSFTYLFYSTNGCQSSEQQSVYLKSTEIDFAASKLTNSFRVLDDEYLNFCRAPLIAEDTQENRYQVSQQFGPDLTTQVIKAEVTDLFTLNVDVARLKNSLGYPVEAALYGEAELTLFINTKKFGLTQIDCNRVVLELGGAIADDAYCE